MGDYSFDIRPILWLAFFAGLAIWGVWELIDWLFLDHVIKSTTKIIPELEIVVKNNVIDTLYVYRKP